MAKDISKHHTQNPLREILEKQQSEAVDLPLAPAPFPLLLLPNSGLYTYSNKIPFPLQPIPIDQPVPIPIPNPDPGPKLEEGLSTAEAAANQNTDSAVLLTSEDLRLDVDGHFPQMKASG